MTDSNRGKQHTIRVANSTDLEAIRALSINSFQSAFADENNGADIAAYVNETFSVEKLSAELANSNNTFLLLFLEAEDTPMGYAKLRSGTTEPSVSGEHPIELERLYLDSAAIGFGLGTALMQASLETAKAQGYETIWLGVWEHNARAIAFYKRWHFQTVGSHVFQLGSDAQTDWIMMRSL